jgi:hypothetical protein
MKIPSDCRSSDGTTATPHYLEVEEKDYEQEATMAANAAPVLIAPGGAPPVVAPQLPHSADPGTITGWILDETVAETPTVITLDMERGFNRLVDNVPDVNDPTYDGIMRQMTDEVISSDTLITYLTATNRWNNVVRVTVVHSIARYSAGFGGSNALHGQVLALLGETVGSQLPMLVKLVDDPTEDLAHGFAMEEVCVPSDAIVDAYFAGPTALDLMPGTTVALGGVPMNLSNLCPIPIAWAPYFMDFKTPHEALQMGRTLLGTLTSVADRNRATPLLDWLRTTCVRMGPIMEDRVRSLLDQGFEQTSPDARVITWMQGKLSPYLKAGITAVPTGGLPGVPPPLPTGTITTQSGEREFSQLETMKIQAACGLTDAQWDTDLPEVYTRMLEEGRTTARVKALLEDVFRPDDLFSLTHVHLGVTTDMAKDIKELNFGYSNDWSYDTCHRGLSPFAVIGVSMATASKRRRQADRFTRTTNLTLNEVTQAETSPDPLPTEYHGLVNLLRRYVELLRHLVGERSGHFVEVMRITAELNARQFIFEALEPNQVASLLWQIFMDARRFFSTGIDTRGNLPQSLLRTTYNEVAIGIVQTHLNVPYAQIIGHGPAEDQPNYPEPRGTSGSGHQESRTFRHVPAAIKSILRGARSKYPTVTVAELMAAHDPPLQYTQVRLGPSGSCLDYLCFGNCKNSRCSYKHTETASIQASRAEAVAPKLGAAYSAYDAAH